MKRLAVCLGIIVFATGGAVAVASVADGTFKGKLKLKGASSIVLKVRGNSLKRIVIRKLPLKCNSGVSYPEAFTFSGDLPIPAGGTVRTTSESYGGARKAKIAVHFAGRKASGTISRTARFDKRGFADPEGTVTCRIGKRRFKASR